MNQTVSEISALWSRVLKEVKLRLNDQRIFDSFLADSYIDRFEGNVAYVVVNSGLAAEILKSKYASLISGAMRDVSETEIELKYVLKDELKESIRVEEPAKPKFFVDATVNPNYTFKSFVVGPSNLEAYQASLLISRNPGTMFNPLFIYGDSGLGKTHLLHAIGNAIKEERPGTKVLLIAASDFVDEYVKFATGDRQGDGINSFFKTNVDVFLVDDIQMLTGKDKTMEMFFLVFNTLVNAGKQIVITSDKHPSNLNGFEPRLKTRFVQGLTMSVKIPDAKTCEEILKSKISSSGLSVDDFDDDVIAFCVSRFSTSVRDLEQAFNRLLFYTITIKPTKHIDLQTAIEAMADLTNVKDEQNGVTERKIISTVAEYYGLSVSQLAGSSRNAQIAMARHIAMYLMRYMLDVSLKSIGKALGDRDHTTVMSGITKVENQLKTDEQMGKAIEELKSRLSN